MDADTAAAFATVNRKLDALAAGQTSVAHNVRETLSQELLLMNSVQDLQVILAQVDTDTTTIAAGLAAENGNLGSISSKLDAESTKLDGVAQQIGGVATLVQQLRDQLANAGVPQSVIDTLTAIQGRTSAAVAALAAASSTLTAQSTEIDASTGKIDAAATALQAIATPPTTGVAASAPVKAG